MDNKVSLIDLVKKEMEKENCLPVLSKQAKALQNEAVKEEPDIQKIGSIIRLDPTLTSQVLKTANSPFYRGLQNVETIREAVIRLGQNEVVNIVMTVIHKGNFNSDVPIIKNNQKRLWNHLVACALGSLWTSKHLSMEPLIPKSFIAGLLHDMGKIYLLTALEKIMKSREIDFKPSAALIDKILDSLHAEHGYHLLRQWNIPEKYAVIARDHHTEEFDHTDLLLVIVRLVNKVCAKMDNPGQTEDISTIVGSREAEILGMTEIGIAELEIAMEDSLKKYTS
jgi:HD-like signal output (HDOD) protein